MDRRKGLTKPFYDPCLELDNLGVYHSWKITKIEERHVARCSNIQCCGGYEFRYIYLHVCKKENRLAEAEVLSLKSGMSSVEHLSETGDEKNAAENTAAT